MAVATKVAPEATHLTREELAKRWQLSVRTIDAKIADGEIQAVRFGKAVRVPIAEVERVDLAGFTPAQ